MRNGGWATLRFGAGALFLCVGLAFGQGSGKITGVATDTTGVVLPTAQISAANCAVR
jgi:hypothetical protein